MVNSEENNAMWILGFKGLKLKYMQVYQSRMNLLGLNDVY